jgi:hypothetical protein
MGTSLTLGRTGRSRFSKTALNGAGSPAVTKGRIAASWTQWGATTGPCPER